MLKRINERSSFYNVAKWERDYEKSQYYKRNHCVYPSIDSLLSKIHAYAFSG